MNQWLVESALFVRQKENKKKKKDIKMQILI